MAEHDLERDVDGAVSQVPTVEPVRELELQCGIVELGSVYRILAHDASGESHRNDQELDTSAYCYTDSHWDG